MSYRAAICRELGPPRVLRIETLARAPLPADYVRVRLHACGVNFPDLLMVAGRYQFKPELPFSPGMEAAGEVIETGADVSWPRIGERVITRRRCGGFAEEIALPARDCLPAPNGFSFAEAACFTAAHMTAFHALTTRAALTRGETLLVLGAAGGVGLAAVEIGKHLGARVIAVASSAEKRAAARSKGADETLAADAPDLTAQTRDITQGRGVDAILVEPVMKPASSEARNTTQRAISSGSPRRPTGICGMMRSASTSSARWPAPFRCRYSRGRSRSR
jgi:NADPH2:quinone reductase